MSNHELRAFTLLHFDLVFITGLFLILFFSWIQTANPETKDFTVGVFGALLATINATRKAWTIANDQPQLCPLVKERDDS